jgi:argininosuccinate lyase
MYTTEQANKLSLEEKISFRDAYNIIAKKINEE